MTGILTLIQAKGRLNRKQYIVIQIGILFSWMTLAVGAVFAIGTTPGDAFAVPSTSLVVVLIFLLLIFLMLIAVMTTIRRLHDRGRAWYWLILFAVTPVVLDSIIAGETRGFSSALSPVESLLLWLAVGLHVWFLVEVVLLSGTDGPNRFGHDPLGDLDMDDRGQDSVGHQRKFSADLRRG